MQAKPLKDAPVSLLAEGPLWMPEEQRLYWLDIEGCRLFRAKVASNDARGDCCEEVQAFALDNQVGCIAPCTQGRFLIAGQDGVFRVELIPSREPGKDGRVNKIEKMVHPEESRSDNRYNDGKCSPEGRFWFGSLNKEKRPNRASLYKMDRDSSGHPAVQTMLSGATNSNGLAWAPDGRTFYWIDTPTRRVDAFDYDPANGFLSNRRTVVTFPPEREDRVVGRPDGMCIDREGYLWIAHWCGGCVTRWNPARGELQAVISLPVRRVTSVTFGGPDLNRLYITTARFGMSESELQDEPLAGRVFVAETGIAGMPADSWKEEPVLV